MKAQKSTLIYVRLAVLLMCSLIAYGDFCFAQTTSSEADPVKLDEYGDLTTDDEAAHLDLFAEALSKQPDLRGYIVAYNELNMERGSYLRRIYGIHKYLSEARGIDPNRVVVIDGGYKEKFATELWLIPNGVAPPIPKPTISSPLANVKSAYKFDEECLDCAAAVNLYLYGLDEGLKFYAEVLRKNPDSQGLIIIRSDKNFNIRKALNEAQRAKRKLIRNHGIQANRIIIKVGHRRNDDVAVAEMWVVPRRIKALMSTSNKSFQPTDRRLPLINLAWRFQGCVLLASAG